MKSPINTQTIDPESITVGDLHGYLLSAVAPRPIAFASTVNSEGQINLSPFSFFNAFSANPPVLVFSPARRGRDNTTKHTFENVKQVPEVVINMVNYSIVEQMSLASTEYDQGVNEFVKSGLTPVPSQRVKPPRVQESPVAFECSVEQIIPLGQQGGAGNLVICRVQLIHIQDNYLDENGKLDTTKLDLVARMGANWYCRALPEALFEIPKPVFNKGIGVDQLPESITNSTVLTGNNLGRLGNLEKLPGSALIGKAKRHPDVMKILSQSDLSWTERQRALHVLAQKLIEQHDTKTALEILMVSDRLER